MFRSIDYYRTCLVWCTVQRYLCSVPATKDPKTPSLYTLMKDTKDGGVAGTSLERRIVRNMTCDTTICSLSGGVEFFALPLPVLDVIEDDVGRALRCVLAADALHKVSLGVLTCISSARTENST